MKTSQFEVLVLNPSTGYIAKNLFDRRSDAVDLVCRAQDAGFKAEVKENGRVILPLS